MSKKPIKKVVVPNPTMVVRRLSAEEWEMESKEVRRDFHLRLEDGMWVLDEFDTRKKDNNSAHIESTSHDTFERGFIEAFDRIVNIRLNCL